MRGIALRLSLAQGAAGLFGGAYTPFFGAWLAWKGLSPVAIGVLLATAMLLRVVVAPLTGMIADARNDRRTMMLLLSTVMLLGYGTLLFATAQWAIFTASILASVAAGAMSPLLESASVRLADRHQFDYGHVRLWASSLFVVGNVLSGFAKRVFGFVMLAPWLTVSVLLNLIAVYLLPRPRGARPRGDFSSRLRATFAEARELLRAPVFLIFLAAASLAQGSHAFYYGYGGLHWTKLGFSGPLIGILWPLGVFVEILLMSYSLRVLRFLGATRLLLIGSLGCVLRWTILAFDPPLSLVVVAQLLHGATFAMSHLGAMYFIVKAVPPRLTATAQSLYAVCWSGMAMGFATLASGPLYTHFGGRTYLLMALMGVGASIFAFLLDRRWQGARVTKSMLAEEDPDAV
ncbi:MAG TPA: MFS transporter [Rhizomicrobium sp.]|nr:MFS transporter [Rhizomicrobium sp.]